MITVQTDLERGMVKRIVKYQELMEKVSNLLYDHDKDLHIWLDTGCGTGGLIRSNIDRFPKTQFVLADPSSDNIATAKESMHGEQRCLYVTKPTHELNFGDSTLDAVTAMFCHHYYQNIDEKRKAIGNCFRMLKEGGIFITAEHVRHDDIDKSDEGWIAYMKDAGLPDEFAYEMVSRRDREYFPLTESEYLELLIDCGFHRAEVFWMTCSDIGIVAYR